jgi:hypothetical protein
VRETKRRRERWRDGVMERQKDRMTDRIKDGKTKNWVFELIIETRKTSETSNTSMTGKKRK